jgi:hypothetical protein
MKYHNKKIIRNGEKWDSIKEYQRWVELCILEQGSLISELRRQVKFVLIPSQRIDGKVVERECAYYADFVYKDNETGETVVEDSKGMRTKDYVIKRKLMLYIHGIRIMEV